MSIIKFEWLYKWGVIKKNYIVWDFRIWLLMGFFYNKMYGCFIRIK